MNEVIPNNQGKILSRTASIDSLSSIQYFRDISTENSLICNENSSSSQITKIRNPCFNIVESM